MNLGVVGQLFIEISANSKSLDSELAAAKKKVSDTGAAMEKSTSESVDSIVKQMDKIGNNWMLKVTTPILAVGTAALKFASDMEETSQKVDVVFGTNANTVKEWASTAIDSMGLASESAMSAAATYGNMASGMGITANEGLKMSMTLTQLAVDLASFNNTALDTAQIALNSVFTGETETLKQYGVVMTEANLQQYAFAQGITNSVRELSQAEQVQLRYNYVLDKTKNAQGDFARTSDSVANQTRTVKERLKEVAAEFGQNLMPIATVALGMINDLVKALADMNPETQKTLIRLAAMAAAVGPLLKFGSSAIKTINSVKSAIQKLTFATKSTSTSLVVAENSARGFGTALNAALGVIGLVVTALSLLSTLFSSINPPDEEITKFADATDELVESSRESRLEYEKNMDEIEGQIKNTKDLVDQLGELSQIEDKNTFVLSEMTDVVSQLNGRYEELNLTIDEGTGKLNKNKDEILKIVEAAYNLDAAMAALDDYNEKLANKARLEDTVTAAIQKYRDAVNQYDPTAAAAIARMSDELIAHRLTSTGQIFVNGLDVGLGSANISAIEASIIAAKEELDALNLAYGETVEDFKKYSVAALESFAALTDEGVTLTATEVEQMSELLLANTSLTDAQQERYAQAIAQQQERIALEEQLARQEQANIEAQVEAIKASNKTISEAEADALEERRRNGEELTEVEQAKLDKYKEIQEGMIALATNTNKEISRESQLSTAKMAQIAEKNLETMGLYDNAMATLRTINNKNFQDYLDSLDTADEATVGHIISMADEFEKNGGQMTDAMKTLGDTYVEATETSWGNVKDVTEQKSEEVIEAAEEVLSEENAQEIVETFVESAADAVDKSGDELIDATRSLVQQARFGASSEALSSKWRDVGKSIANGIAAGVRSRSHVLASAVRGIVNDALKAAQRAAIIHSPSKLFETEVGQMIGAGVARGVKKSTPLVTQAMALQISESANINSALLNTSGMERMITNNNNSKSITVNIPVNVMVSQRLGRDDIVKFGRDIAAVVNTELGALVT